MAKKKKQNKSKAEKAMYNAASNFHLNVDQRAKILAEVIKGFGISEKIEGSIAASLKIAMELHIKCTGAEIALNICTRKTGQWLQPHDTDMSAMIGILRKSSLFKELRETHKDPIVPLAKDMEAFALAIHKAKGGK